MFRSQVQILSPQRITPDSLAIGSFFYSLKPVLPPTCLLLLSSRHLPTAGLPSFATFLHLSCRRPVFICRLLFFFLCYLSAACWAAFFISPASPYLLPSVICGGGLLNLVGAVLRGD